MQATVQRKTELVKKGFRSDYASRKEIENQLAHLQNQNQNLKKTVKVVMNEERN